MEIARYFVETAGDREIIESLKSNQPTLLVGSRGTGKTMLLKIAEKEISDDFHNRKKLPVFVNLSSCSIHNTNMILNVIISRTLISLRKSLREHGILLKGNIFKPVTDVNLNPIVAKLEEYIADSSEVDDESAEIEINSNQIQKDTAQLIDFLTELCDEYKFISIVFFFDEACQVFCPSQQRIFFDFFRAMRAHNIVCKASVYPGIVSYGSFQKFHDATIKRIERSIVSTDYVEKMREIVRRNYPNLYTKFEQQGELLDNIIFYSSGNPRFLLKSINEIISDNNKLTVQRSNDVIKDFYGTTIWSEHVKLSQIYPGHAIMINWARNFIENTVIPSIHKINNSPQSKTTIYFVISRRAPEVVRQAIKTLEYSGIISLHTEGTKYRNEMYDRYELNLGIVVLSEKQVSVQKRGKEIVSNLSVKVFPDYGTSSSSYENYNTLSDISSYEADTDELIAAVTNQNIDALELSLKMKNRLHANDFNYINDVFIRGEDELRTIPYIGVIRSRKIANLVFNAILEYISG